MTKVPNFLKPVGTVEFRAPSLWLSASFDVKPEQAVNYFQGKGLKKTFMWWEMQAEQHTAAFTVAKMMDVDLLKTTQAAIDHAIDNGLGTEWLNENLIPEMQKKGWWGKNEAVKIGDKPIQLGSPARLQTIYRTNMQSAYAVGQWDAIQDAKLAMPYLMYDAIDDNRTRPEHAALNNIIRPIEDPFWRTHYPPNGWNCRCSTIQLSDADLVQHGLKQTPDAAMPNGKKAWENPMTGQTEIIPEAIDPGFNFNPGVSYAAHLAKIAKQKINDLPAAAKKAAKKAPTGPSKKELAAIAAKGKANAKAAEKLEDIALNPKGQTLKAKALAKLEKDGVAADLDPVALLAQVEKNAAAAQAKASHAAAVSGYKKNVLAGKSPTPAQVKAFDQMDEGPKAALLKKIDEANEAELKILAEKKANDEAMDKFIMLQTGELADPGKWQIKAYNQLSKIPGWDNGNFAAQWQALQAQAAKLQAKNTLAGNLSKYKTAVIAGKKPSPAIQKAYDSLDGQAKAAFDAKIAKAVGQKKAVDEALEGPAIAYKSTLDMPDDVYQAIEDAFQTYDDVQSATIAIVNGLDKAEDIKALASGNGWAITHPDNLEDLVKVLKKQAKPGAAKPPAIGDIGDLSDQAQLDIAEMLSGQGQIGAMKLDELDDLLAKGWDDLDDLQAGLAQTSLNVDEINQTIGILAGEGMTGFKAGKVVAKGPKFQYKGGYEHPDMPKAFKFDTADVLVDTDDIAGNTQALKKTLEDGFNDSKEFYASLVNNGMDDMVAIDIAQIAKKHKIVTPPAKPANQVYKTTKTLEEMDSEVHMSILQDLDFETGEATIAKINSILQAGWKDKDDLTKKLLDAINPSEVATTTDALSYYGIITGKAKGVVQGTAKAAAKVADDAPILKTAPSKAPVFENLTQTGPQKGSNPGGRFKDPETGQEYYIKLPGDEDYARNEVLTAELYKLAGIDAPDVFLIDISGSPFGTGGGKGVASRIIDGLSENQAKLKTGKVSSATDGFVTDAWLANHDVVGLGYDNLLMRGSKAIRVDTGGGLRYRAQGLKKTAWGSKVDELDTMRDANINSQAASVFGKMTDDQVEASAAKVLAIADDDIRATVKKYGPTDAKENKKLADTLIARKKDISKRTMGEKAKAAQAEAKKFAIEMKQSAVAAEIDQVYAKMLETIKGIAYRASQGKAIEAKDMGRAMTARKMLNKLLKGDTEVNISTRRAVKAHFEPWMVKIEDAIDGRTGHAAKWDGGVFETYKGSILVNEKKLKIPEPGQGPKYTDGQARDIIQNALGSYPADMAIPSHAGDAHFKSMSIHYRRAISTWTGSSYSDVTKPFLLGRAGASIGRYVDLFDDALKSSTKKYEGEIARGLSWNDTTDDQILKKMFYDEHAKIGDIVETKVPASWKKGTTPPWGEGAVLHIKKSTKGVDTNPISMHHGSGEDEVTMPIFRYRLVDRWKEGRTDHFRIEEID